MNEHLMIAAHAVVRCSCLHTNRPTDIGVYFSFSPCLVWPSFFLVLLPFHFISFGFMASCLVLFQTDRDLVICSLIHLLSFTLSLFSHSLLEECDHLAQMFQHMREITGHCSSTEKANCLRYTHKQKRLSKDARGDSTK